MRYDTSFNQGYMFSLPQEVIEPITKSSVENCKYSGGVFYVLKEIESGINNLRDSKSGSQFIYPVGMASLGVSRIDNGSYEDKIEYKDSFLIVANKKEYNLVSIFVTRINHKKLIKYARHLFKINNPKLLSQEIYNSKIFNSFFEVN